MSYLSHLVGRTLGSARVAQPVMRGSFAPRALSPSEPDAEASPAARGEAGDEPARQAPSRPERAVSPRAERGDAAQSAATPLLASQRAARAASERFRLVESSRRADDIQALDLYAGSFPPAARPVAAAQASPHADALSAAAGPVSAHVSDEAAAATDAAGNFHLVPARPHPAPRVEVAAQQTRVDAEGPVVRVQIGRVDVRLVSQNQADKGSPAPRGTGARPVPLEEYLKARERGQR
jgi:hypothetical protein